MKLKKIITLVILCAVLGLLAYFMNHSSEAGWTQPDAEDPSSLLIPEDELDLTKVAAVTLASEGTTVTMKKVDGTWQVAERYGYPANLNALQTFLMTLADCRVARPLSLSDAQLSELKLKENAGATVLTLADDKGTELKKVIFGAVHMQEGDQAPKQEMFLGGRGPSSDGRFIAIDGKPVLVAETFGTVESKHAYWLNKDFFKISDLREGALYDNGKVLWSVSRKDKSAELVLAGTIPANKEVDASKLSSVKNAFSWMNYNDVADPAAKPADLGFDKMKTFVAKDFDGFTYSIQFGAAVNSKRYLKLASVTWKGETTRTPGKDEKPEDKAKLDAEFAKKVKENQDKAAKLNADFSKWTFEVSSYSVDAVDKTFLDLLKNKPEPAKPEPAKAEPKKAEAKKAEPAKAEPKKAEAKKAEPAKAEPKKAEAKKVEPAKAEPKKAEAKKAEPAKAEAKK